MNSKLPSSPNGNRLIAWGSEVKGYEMAKNNCYDSITKKKANPCTWIMGILQLNLCELELKHFFSDNKTMIDIWHYPVSETVLQSDPYEMTTN